MRGKETLSEKITKTEITEWKEQKYHKLAFFKTLSTTFLTEDVTKICSNLLSEASQELPKNLITLFAKWINQQRSKEKIRD